MHVTYRFNLPEDKAELMTFGRAEDTQLAICKFHQRLGELVRDPDYPSSASATDVVGMIMIDFLDILEGFGLSDIIG